MSVNTTYEKIPVTTLPSGFELFIPLRRLEGRTPGPTLGLSAVVHGDEPLTNEVIRQGLMRIDPAESRGTILAVPIVNTLAFESLTRHTPIDMLDLNRNLAAAWSDSDACSLGACSARSASSNSALNAEWPLPTTSTRLPAWLQVPDASMTLWPGCVLRCHRGLEVTLMRCLARGRRRDESRRSAGRPGS